MSRIIGRFIGGPRHGEQIDFRTSTAGDLPETINVPVPQPLRTLWDIDGDRRPPVLSSSAYTYIRREGVARIEQPSRVTQYPRSLYDQTDVRFTAWVGRDVSDDRAMQLVIEVLESAPGFPHEMREYPSPYTPSPSTPYRLRGAGEPPSYDYPPPRHPFPAPPNEPPLSRVLDLIGDLESQHRAELIDRGIDPDTSSATPFIDDEILARIFEHGRAGRIRVSHTLDEIDRLPVGPRSAMHLPETAPDPMGQFNEINEYLDGEWPDAMRCRPKRNRS